MHYIQNMVNGQFFTTFALYTIHLLIIGTLFIIIEIIYETITIITEIIGTETIGENFIVCNPLIYNTSIKKACTKYAPKLYFDSIDTIALSLSLSYFLYLNHV